MPDLLNECIQTLERGEDLPDEVAESTAHALMDPDGVEDQKSAFLKALTRKGETADELAAFARVFRQMAVDPGLGSDAEEAIDVCGTGGDRSSTFNVSTITGFVLAACGVPVIKHGNRSITSSCGSADLLEALRIPIEKRDSAVHRHMLTEHHFTFLFAPSYHPAFKVIAPVRKALAAEGQRTVFNLLGPLLNPANPGHQLMGVYSKEWVVPAAMALGKLGIQRGMVVHGSLPGGGGLDELSTATEHHSYGVGALKQERLAPNIESYGLNSVPIASLKGGDLETNLNIFQQFVDGCPTPAHRETVALNAGVGLWIANRVNQITDGIECANRAILDGKLGKWYQKLRSEVG